MANAVSNVNVNQQAGSTSTFHSSAVGGGGGLGIDLGFFSIGGSASGSSYDSKATSAFASSLSQHADSSSRHMEVSTRAASSTSIGEVSTRTALVRYNGPDSKGQPSFTILYSRCVHLGCPVQPNGPIDEKDKKTFGNVELRPVLAQSFGCPCHGGQYNSEGNRTAGPPVRSMDRFEYSIKDRHLILGQVYAVGSVTGSGADAKISKYPWSTPGTHVDGIEAWLYPIVPSQVTG